MRVKQQTWTIIIMATTLALSVAARGADLSESIKTLRAVSNEGAGNTAASAAVKTIGQQASANDLAALLAAMDGANPLAVNWLRAAVETVADKAINSAKNLPVKDLEAFLLDTKHDPQPRRLAYELIARVDTARGKALVSKFINDPSVELRRDAVQQVMNQADKAYDAKDKDAAATTYLEALHAARDVDQIEHAADRLRELGRTVDLPTHFGFLMNWKVVGPFDNTKLIGFAAVYPPEKGVDLDATYEGKAGQKIKWVDYTTKDEYGMVDINQALAELKGTVAYAWTEYQAADDRDVEIRLGCKNAWKIWVNGKLAWEREEYHRGMQIDQYRVTAHLKKGANTIMMKLCQDEREYSWTKQWQFQLRVCDETGTAILSTDRTGKAALLTR